MSVDSDLVAIGEIAGTVVDPELPVLTLRDLGIVRGVARDPTGTVTVTITPTYSGCPALRAIRSDITERLAEHGYRDVAVRTALAPPWSTDWITEEGRRKLVESGIAPPGPTRRSGPVALPLTVRCPNCGAPRTREVSAFGSTACKALYVCDDCAEPFERVKPL